EARANPHLSSGMPTFNLNKPIYLAFFIIHSESALGNDALAVFTAESDPRKPAPSDSVPQQQGKGASFIARQVKEEASNTIKLEDLAKLVSNVKPSFKDLDSPEDDSFIIIHDQDKEDEVHTTTNAETKDTSVPKSSSPSISLPTELKDLPSKFNEMTEEVKGLKKQVHELEIELPGDLKEILTKLEEFTKTVTSLTSQVDELKALQWELPAEFLLLLVHVTSVQAKLKTLDALLGLLLNVTKASNKFAQKFDFITENGKHIHLTKEQINQQKKIEEEAKAEAAKHEREVRKVELVDLLGPEVVNKYYNDKLQYDKYYDKMLPIRDESRIINCDDLTKKDPLGRLNDLVNKKRKHAADIHDYFKANKRFKSSVQCKDHLPGTVLNEPILGPTRTSSDQVKKIKKLEEDLGHRFEQFFKAEAESRLRRGDGRTEKDIAVVLSNTSNLDIEGSKVWKEKYHELFTMKYPYVQKISDSHRLRLSDLMNASPDVLPPDVDNQAGSSVHNVDGDPTNPNPQDDSLV
nr:transposase (putative), gypsy type [Tanacetum cinerariifolium]